MDKRVFLAHLKLELRGLPDEEIEDIMRDYEHYFAEASASGMDEQKAIDRLGEPREIAANLKKDTKARQVDQSSKQPQNVLVIIGLIFFNLVFVLGPVVGVAGLAFGLFVMAGAFIVSPLLALFKMLMGNPHLFELFLSLVLSGVGLLLLPLLVKGCKIGAELLEKYAHWNLKQMRGEGYE